MQQPPGRLARLLDVLIQHARRIVTRFDHQRVALEPADRMTERAARTAFRMILHVHVHDAPHVHPLVMQHDVGAVAHDFERRARGAPDAADGDRIAAKCRVILERIVGGDGLLSGRRQELNHRLRTAGAPVPRRREQPGAEDVRPRRQRRWTGRSRRAVDAHGAAVRELDAVEEAHVGAVPRQRSLDSDPGAGFEERRRQPVARELRDAVRFADVLPGPAILVFRRNMEVTVRVARLELGHRPGDAGRFVRVEVRREAMVRIRVRRSEQSANDDCKS